MFRIHFDKISCRICLIIICSALLFSCKKEYSHEGGIILIAHGTLKDSLGNCLPDSVHGTFYNGITPGSDTCFAEIQVNVTQAGSYNISTDLQNGLQFIDSGFFNTLGINTIRLKTIGTPILPLTTIFSVSFDSSVCSFFVDVKDSTGTGLGGGDTTGNGGGGDTTQAGLNMWKFTNSSSKDFFNGTATAFFDTTLYPTPTLIITGISSISDSTLKIDLNLGDSTLSNFVPGIYPTGNNGEFYFIYKSGLSYFNIYVASAGPEIMNVNLTGYDSTTRILTGKFSGTVLNTKTHNTETIIDGSFTVVVQ